MKRILRHRKYWRVLLFVALASLLSVAARAQDDSQFKDAPRSKKAPLEFKLILLTPTRCIGEPLKLRLEVTNVGSETLRINRAYFWNDYTFYLSASDVASDDREFFITHVWPVSTNEDLFLLGPGKKAVAHRYWSPDDEPTKIEPGSYTLEIGGYGVLNKVDFELQDCKQKRIKEQ